MTSLTSRWFTSQQPHLISRVSRSTSPLPERVPRGLGGLFPGTRVAGAASALVGESHSASQPGSDVIAAPPLPGLSKTEISCHVAEEEGGMLVVLEILI